MRRTTARGRDAFHRFRHPLRWLAGFLAFLPPSFSEFLWQSIPEYSGKFTAGLRYAVAKRLAGELGDNVFFGPRVRVLDWNSLRVGSNVSIHQDCYIDALGGIGIGSDVSIAHGCSIVSFDHSWSDVSRPIRDNPVIKRPIVIRDDVWIGCGVRVLGGAAIGHRTVVAAGAVVTQPCGPNALVGGVPARQLKSLC